jgi:hypothetical protein
LNASRFAFLYHSELKENPRWNGRDQLYLVGCVLLLDHVELRGLEVKMERRASQPDEMNWQCAVQTGEYSGSCRSCLYICSKLSACESDQSQNRVEAPWLLRGSKTVCLCEKDVDCERLINLVSVGEKVMILYTLR